MVLQPWQSDVFEILEQSSAKFEITDLLEKVKIYTMSMAVSMEEKIDFIFDAIKDILTKFENLEKTFNDKFDLLQEHVNLTLFEI